MKKFLINSIIQLCIIIVILVDVYFCVPTILNIENPSHQPLAHASWSDSKGCEILFMKKKTQLNSIKSKILI